MNHLCPIGGGTPEDKVKKFLNKNNVFAVVGVSRNPSKYGRQVYEDLLNHDYRVFPVNPSAKEINGRKCYPTLLALPEKPDVVDFVVPPKIAEKLLGECKKLGVDKVWFQPGSESKKSVNYCKENDIDFIENDCVMVQLRKL